MTLTRKLTVTLTVELIEEIKRRAKNLFGERSGYVSHYVEMVLRNDLGLTHKDVEEV